MIVFFHTLSAESLFVRPSSDGDESELLLSVSFEAVICRSVTKSTNQTSTPENSPVAVNTRDFSPLIRIVEDVAFIEWNWQTPCNNNR